MHLHWCPAESCRWSFMAVYRWMKYPGGYFPKPYTNIHNKYGVSPSTRYCDIRNPALQVTASVSLWRTRTGPLPAEAKCTVSAATFFMILACSRRHARTRQSSMHQLNSADRTEERSRALSKTITAASLVCVQRAPHDLLLGWCARLCHFSYLIYSAFSPAPPHARTQTHVR